MIGNSTTIPYQNIWTPWPDSTSDDYLYHQYTLQRFNFCPNCGRRPRSNWNYCADCGRYLFEKVYYDYQWTFTANTINVDTNWVFST